MGWVAVAGGLSFIANAIPVGYRGFQATPVAMVAMIALAVTAIGLIIVGARARDVTHRNADERPSVEPAFR